MLNSSCKVHFHHWVFCISNKNHLFTIRQVNKLISAAIQQQCLVKPLNFAIINTSQNYFVLDSAFLLTGFRVLSQHELWSRRRWSTVYSNSNKREFVFQNTVLESSGSSERQKISTSGEVIYCWFIFTGQQIGKHLCALGLQIIPSFPHLVSIMSLLYDHTEVVCNLNRHKVWGAAIWQAAQLCANRLCVSALQPL